MAAREPFAKVAAGLDGNRKIIRAGRNGREVYLWILRLVAQRSTAGVVPAEDVQDYAFAARTLMCTEAEAKEGVERATKEKLIRFSRGQCYVVGWDEEWGRRPLTGAERQARYKTRDADDKVTDGSSLNDGENVTPTKSDEGVTVKVTGNAVEESRVEESRVDVRVSSAGAERSLFSVGDDPPPSAPPEPALVLSIALCESLGAIGKGFKPDTEATLDLARKLVKRRPKTTPDEVRRVVEAKAAEWSDDAEERKWLRPSTLFAFDNFNKYLVELEEGADNAPPVRWTMPEV